MKKVFWVTLTMLMMVVIVVISGCDFRQTNSNKKEEEEISDINKEDITWYYGEWMSATTPRFILSADEDEVVITHAMNGEIETTRTEAIYKGVDGDVNVLLDNNAIKELFPHLFEDGEVANAKGLLMKDGKFKENTGRDSILLSFNMYDPDGNVYDEPININFTRYEDDSYEEEKEEELERWNSRRKNTQDSDDSDMDEDEGVESPDSYAEETDEAADFEVIDYEDLDTSDPVQNEAKLSGCYIVDNGEIIEFIPHTSETMQNLQLYLSEGNEEFYEELKASVIEASLHTEGKPVSVLEEEEESGKESEKVVLTVQDGEMIYSK